MRFNHSYVLIFSVPSLGLANRNVYSNNLSDCLIHSNKTWTKSRTKCSPLLKGLLMRFFTDWSTSLGHLREDYQQMTRGSWRVSHPRFLELVDRSKCRLEEKARKPYAKALWYTSISPHAISSTNPYKAHVNSYMYLLVKNHNLIAVTTRHFSQIMLLWLLINDILPEPNESIDIWNYWNGSRGIDVPGFCGWWKVEFCLQIGSQEY